jgi:hypothetical protein
MADTSGIAALMKALNDSPTLGGGLKPSTIARPASTAKSAGIGATTGIGTASRGIRSAAPSVSAAAPIKLPRVLTAEGQDYNPKAPRGSYVDLVV